MRFRYACITWGILILALIGMTYKLNKLESIITSLNYNQTLILRQLEESEKEIKDIDKLIEAVKSAPVLSTAKGKNLALKSYSTNKKGSV